MPPASRRSPVPWPRRSRALFARLPLQAYLLITLGVVLLAAANDLFLIPNNVFSGGVTGIAVVTNHLFGWSVGLTYFAFNVPLLLAGLRWLGGWRFLVRTLYAVVLLSFLIDALRGVVPPITHEPILYTLYGGLLDGLGLGLVFRAYGTTGGADIVALLLQRFRGLAINQSLIGFDVLVYALAALVLGADRALYALIGSYASSRVVTLVQEGLPNTRIVYIISSAPDRVARQILTDLQRGVTFLRGTGGYTGADLQVILVVVRQPEINMLTDLVHAADPQAFVIIGDARAVLGEGFRPLPPPGKP